MGKRIAIKIEKRKTQEALWDLRLKSRKKISRKAKGAKKKSLEEIKELI